MSSSKATPRGRSGRGGGDAPTTTDPIDIAMAAVSGDGPGDGPARELLEKQSGLIDDQRRHLRLQIASERFAVVLKSILAIAAFAAAVAVVVLVLSAMNSRAVVVEAFAAPPSLAAQGQSGEVLAAALQDELQRIQAATRTTAAQRDIANAWTGDIAVQVPSTGVSVGDIERVLRERLGNDIHVRGALTRGDDGQVTLTVRGDRIRAKSFTGPPAQLPALTVQAAEHVFGEAEPTLLAHYLYQQHRLDDGFAFVSRAYGRVKTESDRAFLANNWGNLLWGKYRFAEAAQKFRLALRHEPTRWGSWRNLAGVTVYAAGDEAALAVTQEMRRAADAAPRRLKPESTAFEIEALLRQDYTTLLDIAQADARKVAGGTLLTSNGVIVAIYESARHDWTAAEAGLMGVDPSDAMFLPTRRRLEGERLLEQDPAAAVAPLEALDRLWKTDPTVRAEFTETPCQVGLAYAHVGRARAASEALWRMPPTGLCAAYRGDAFEALGKPAAADAAYRQAIALAPSLPFAYQRWGLTLLERGDLAQAERRFAQAHARGPRWADPLKSQGDVLMAQGRRREAAARYAQALQFAPGWQALKAAKAAADGRVR
jgi:Tfp pilus assembly protein PilF